eukprot:14633702-Alexandrium_andersonii.AAC.1
MRQHATHGARKRGSQQANRHSGTSTHQAHARTLTSAQTAASTTAPARTHARSRARALLPLARKRTRTGTRAAAPKPILPCRVPRAAACRCYYKR